MAAHHTTVDEYVASLSDAVRSTFEQLVSTIRTALPNAEETIRYQMPTFGLNGRSLVHLAAWKHHIGMYPMPAIPPDDEPLEQRVAPYRTAKGTGRFPLAQPFPYDLIERLVTLLADQRRDDHLVKPSATDLRTEQP